MNPFLYDPVVRNEMSRPRAGMRRLPRWPMVGHFRPRYTDWPATRRHLTNVASRLVIGCGLGMAVMPAQALDANAATVEQLETLNGVGARTAKIIIQERERAGPFESLEDLSDRVRGIGRKRLGRLQAAGLTVGAGLAILSPNTIAMPHFAPTIPGIMPPAP